jgi:nucleoside-diphosphate-sugar epimerase
MSILVTGASGFIGRAVVQELVAAGHEVTGLVRSEAAAASVTALGATPLRGDLDDLAGIGTAAKASDGVVHLANKHDFVNRGVSNAAERGAVETIAEALAGSDRPFVLASGTALGLNLGRPITEDDVNPAVGPDSPRGGSERLALDFADRGVRVVAARFAPTVHGEGDHGFVRAIAEAARSAGVVRYPGEGTNVWSAVHRGDVARMVRLGLEKAPAGSVLHGVAEAVPVRDFLTALAGRLDLPAQSAPATEIAAGLPFIGMALCLDLPASSDRTRRLLGWEPTGPTLLEDIAAGYYDPA